MGLRWKTKFQAKEPTVEKALCCLMAVEAEWRDCWPEQAEVRMKRSSKLVGRMPRTPHQTMEESL